MLATFGFDLRYGRAQLFFILVSTLYVNPSDAWGCEGHMLTAAIAQVRLSPEAGAQVSDLLSLDRGVANQVCEIGICNRNHGC